MWSRDPWVQSGLEHTRKEERLRKILVEVVSSFVLGSLGPSKVIKERIKEEKTKGKTYT